MADAGVAGEVVVIVEAQDQRCWTIVDGDVWLCIGPCMVINVTQRCQYAPLRLQVLLDFRYLYLE